MALVYCEIRAGEDCIENGTLTSFYAPLPVTKAAVTQLFPFEGDYHFRVKVSGKYVGMSSSPSLWLDLTQDQQQEVPVFENLPGKGPVVYIQALVVNLHPVVLPVQDSDLAHPDELTAAEDEEYLERMSGNMPLGAAERLPRLQVDVRSSGSSSSSSRGKGGVSGALSDMAGAAGKLLKKGLGSTTLSSVSDSLAAGGEKLEKSAGSLWGSVTSVAAGIFGGSGSSVLSDATVESLSLLSDALDERIEKDDSLLLALWSILSLDSHIAESGQESAGYARTSVGWKVMGWQKEDPLLDLKTTGTLAIRCMVHMGSRYTAQTQDMLARNKQNHKTKYPFAIVGVNITLLLVDVLNLKEHGFIAKTNGNYWELFEESTAFYDIFSVCFLYMDKLWTQHNAVRADFGKLTAHIKEAVTKVLLRGPKSLAQFRKAAADAGMV